ncbi:hypothetical protein [Pseudoalteromonas tunicata]|jgi:hypothetical protein|uniref:Uncharacterized protein n=1 Tax=Pseudoalteromonas tunicata D2 TaxID=87626 RepID=A4C5S6_9GAMM|nr:hypothetical protein [Pseudoalteromonas tunicata]ATC95305.1 hypothetical protein PTUN_a2899 [Pseudoalteromonas tunicata]AXT30905.1 hypothetical protein D1819_08930 [Pseudoalteromonas tunicata]EAR29330.1 hypothetical protein PTD2_10959 [Pseudoalteromonas tunicata D2]MDP4984162.1 hypothetical protein [Pseudoalteromonas tunicata]MDP5213103.1 hypothetical protein [Pseudoalteromonas tunicata]
MTNENKVIYSMTWFQPEEWQKLKETVDDPTSLDDSYENWKKGAEQAIRDFREKGQTVQKISVKIDKLLAWCNTQGLKPDAKARAQYAAYLAQQKASK